MRYLKKNVSLQHDKKNRIMTTVIIEDNSVQAKSFVEYTRTLPFATVVMEKAKSFEEAVAECNGVSVKTFTNELRRQIDEHFDTCVQ